MKRSVFATAALFAALCTTPMMSARTFEPIDTFGSVTVHFSEPVQVAGKPLPAGDCTITMLPSQGASPMVQFTSANGKSVLAFVSVEQRPNRHTAAQSGVVLDKTQVSRIEVAGNSVDLVLSLTN